MRSAARELFLLDNHTAEVEEEYLHKKALLLGAEHLARTFFAFFGRPGVEDAGSEKNAYCWEELATFEAVNLLLPGIYSRSIDLCIQLEELGDKRDYLAAVPARKKGKRMRFEADEA